MVVGQGPPFHVCDVYNMTEGCEDTGHGHTVQPYLRATDGAEAGRGRVVEEVLLAGRGLGVQHAHMPYSLATCCSMPRAPMHVP